MTVTMGFPFAPLLRGKALAWLGTLALLGLKLLHEDNRVERAPSSAPECQSPA